MNFQDIRSAIAANISVLGGDISQKGPFTPFVTITYLRLSDKLAPSQGFSFFYRALKSTTILGSSVFDLQAKAFTLTSEALGKINSGLPIRNKTGQANVLKISNKEFVIVTVIADDPDCIFFCNSVSAIVSSLH